MAEKEYLFHYTNIGALPSMFQQKGICLWTTNTQFLNDKNELSRGLSFLHKINPKLLSDPNELYNEYVVSLSKAEDSLNMWIAYASSGKGVAIGFDRKKLETFLEEKYYPHGDCFYDEDQFEAEFKKEVPDYLIKEQEEMTFFDPKATPLDFYSLLCLRLKDKAYMMEEEYRIVKYVYPYPSVQRYTDIKFRERQGVLVPYIELIIPYDCVNSIWLGPSNSIEQNRVSINILQKTVPMKDKIEIKESLISFRG